MDDIIPRFPAFGKLFLKNSFLCGRSQTAQGMRRVTDGECSVRQSEGPSPEQARRFPKESVRPKRESAGKIPDIIDNNFRPVSIGVDFFG